MIDKRVTALVSAGLLAFAGTAFAAGDGASPGSPSSSAETERPAGAAPGMRGSDQGSSSAPGSASTAEKPESPPASIVGKDVVNQQNDKIGEIDSVSGKQVIVSVGGFLGMGDRKVALDWEQLSLTGTGEDTKIQTSMTKEQLEQLPEHESEAPTQSGGSGAGGSRY